MAVNHVMAQLMGKCKVNPSRMSDIQAIVNTGKKPLRDRYPQPIPGTVLSLLYQEQEYRVTVTWATTDGEGSKTIGELIFSPVYLRCSLVHHERFGRQA
jgi:hypothetical protein